ncbi:alpha/beta-hydrolase [Coniochaeta ligniaria NRRL 30616]|uniref:Alpha/beta-hydrolase n=1 Tax=Coniochaeta ligniaria NRRL 30616 TaxID=1408157 RepID=A0A1J7J7J2_9PEZI|nr:alpha/beta-hydrolase [Coniochaeta ligniaria NRRL 30616]
MSFRTELIDIGPNIKISALISRSPNQSQQAKSPTVIFLHFWGGSSRTWSLVNPLVAQKYPTTAFDFRGWGGSTGPNDADAYSIAALASDIDGALKALNLDTVVLVGLSMGAKVAQLLAGSLPAHAVSGLVLVSPAPSTALTLPSEMRDQQIHAYDNPDSAEFVARNVLTESFRARDLPDFVVDDMLRGSRWAREAWPAYAMEEDVSEAAGRIAVPVLIVASANDVVEPLVRVRTEVCGRISGARMEVVPGSGHLSPLDAPESVAEHILGFIGGLDLS